jgi:hypothetical protein
MVVVLKRPLLFPSPAERGEVLRVFADRGFMSYASIKGLEG